MKPRSWVDGQIKPVLLLAISPILQAVSSHTIWVSHYGTFFFVHYYFISFRSTCTTYASLSATLSSNLSLSDTSLSFNRPFPSSPQSLFQSESLERFSNDCRKTKTKAITPTNYDRNRQRDEPITIPSNYLKLAQSEGKITRTWRGWFWFWFSLVEKLARVF